jgi:hypothetical protein
VLVPDASTNPRLSFQHWYKIHPLHAGDVRVLLGDGTEEVISTKYAGDSGGWSPALLPLTKYAGKVVRLKFRFGTYVDADWPGWFIDDVRILPPTRNARPQLQPLPAVLATVGSPVELQLMATDVDSNQTIRYSILGGGGLTDATLDALSGKFTWRPASNEVATLGGQLLFAATDDGTPPLRDVLAVPVLGIRAEGDEGPALPVMTASTVSLVERWDHRGFGLRIVGVPAGFKYTLQQDRGSHEWTEVLSEIPVIVHGHIPSVLVPPPDAPQASFYRLVIRPSQP